MSVTHDGTGQRPTVSVLMVTYNHQPYIRQAVESVLSQRTAFDYEIVVGEDCSTDGTQDVLRRLDSDHPDRLRLLLRQKNVGGTRNFAATFSACRGDYVALLEGDDYWADVHKLQIQVDYMESHPDCSLCHHAVEYRFEDGSHPPERQPMGVKPISTIEDLLGGVNFIQTCSAIFPRHRLSEIPAWVGKLPLGDWPMWCLLAETGNIAFIDQVMAVYRVRRGSAWYHQPMVYRTEGVLSMYQELRRHLDPKYSAQITGTLARLSAMLGQLYHMAGERERSRLMLRDAMEYLRERDNGRHRPLWCRSLAGITHFGEITWQRFATGVGARFPRTHAPWHWLRRHVLRRP